MTVFKASQKSHWQVFLHASLSWNDEFFYSKSQSYSNSHLSFSCHMWSFCKLWSSLGGSAVNDFKKRYRCLKYIWRHELKGWAILYFKLSIFSILNCVYFYIKGVSYFLFWIECTFISFIKYIGWKITWNYAHVHAQTQFPWNKGVILQIISIIFEESNFPFWDCEYFNE